MEKERKEYGGCLNILLPVWIIGQIFSLVYNLTLFGIFINEPIIPILLIGINLIALVGIIMLLQFKKVGFYLFISAYIFSLIFIFVCPETSVRSTTVKLFLGMCIFLILMSIKNRNTKKNGYQTLGIFSCNNKDGNLDRSPKGNEDYVKDESIIQNQEKHEVDPENCSYTNNIVQDVDDLEEQTDKTTIIQNDLENNPNEKSVLSSQIHSEGEKKSSKNIIISVVIAIIMVIIGVTFITMHDWRSDEEIYQDGKKHIEEQKYEKGIEELEKIQEHYIPAKALLGELYTLNDSVKRDFPRGEKFLWEAYEANDSNACRSLTDICIDRGDWNKAKEVFEKGIGLGLWKGYRGLAYLYATDELGGTPNKSKDYKKAEFYASKIADKDSWCCGILGVIYSEGGDGIEQNYSKAFYWWNKGVKIGGEKSSQCYSNLGYLYHNGYGIKQNYKKAFEAYKKAIILDKEDHYPYYQLSVMFRNGQYVKANRDSVRYYLQKAAERGDEDASVELENEF